MKNILLFILLLGFKIIDAQNNSNTDSLREAVKTMRADTNRLHALHKLANRIGHKDSVEAMKYANEMLALARELKDVKGAAKAWQAMGLIMYNQHSFKRAAYFLEKGALAFKEANYNYGYLDCNSWLANCYRRTANYPLYAKYLHILETEAKRVNHERFLARAYEGYGNLYRYLGQYTQSIENYVKAIDISERLGELDEAAVALNNLSLVYGMIGQTDEELKIELRTYKIIVKQKDSSNLVLCLSNLSSSYQNMNKMDTARRCIDMAMDIIRKKGEENLNFKDVASVYGQFSSFAAAEKDFKTAVEYQNKNIKISKENGDIKTVANAYSSLADIFLLMGNKAFTEEYYLKSLDINKDIGFIDGQVKNYESLISFYKSQKNSEPKVEEYQKLLTILSDSLAHMTNAKKLAEAEALVKIQEQKEQLILFEEERKKEELELKERQRQTYLLIGGGIFVMLILLLAIRYRRAKK